MLAASCGLLLFACAKEASSEREKEIRVQLIELETIRNNEGIGSEEKRKKTDQLAVKLSRLYPAAPPFGKDTTERIIKPTLPDTVGPFRRVDRYTFYKVMSSNPASKSPLDSAYATEKYFSGLANYGLWRGKKHIPNQGVLVIVTDYGFYPEWLGILTQEQTLKGNTQAAFRPYLRSHQFEKVTEHLGQKWAVWYDPSQPRRNHVGSRVFLTHWNHRFGVMVATTDTTEHVPVHFAKLVDVEWLNRLKYPRR
ncbi:hypothetical protein BLX24_28210 [Arsenicibacter rosenii]|uniref:Uncharacterized protein n=2 Tax=Arsenicibacter rosenii TaxID=1750698 RepID=A0A1S2VAL4_9BACT|nr:hypothetical protein BLX24_28210 [Arsenicibacter rosenii]